MQGPLGPNTGASNTASASASTPALDVWIIAGQSNAVGENYLDGTSMPQPCASPVRGRLLMYPLSTSNWTDAAPSVGDISNGRFVHSSIGPDMGFGRALLSSGESNLVGLVPTAMASTGLASHWMPPASFLYKRMISGARAAVAAANAAGQAAQLQGLIWVQVRIGWGGLGGEGRTGKQELWWKQIGRIGGGGAVAEAKAAGCLRAWCGCSHGNGGRQGRR